MADHPITPYVPRDLNEAEKLSAKLAKSPLLPDALRGKPDDVLVILITGSELGLSPMQSIRGIHVIKGRPVMAADMMVALVKRSPECRSFKLVESTETRCTYSTLRAGDDEPTIMSYTIEEARAAGLTGKDVWKQHTRAMLRARCASALARAVYPDLLAGVYETDEGREIAERRQPAAPSAPKVRDIVIQQNAASVEAEQSADAVDVELDPEPPSDPWLDKIAACATDAELNALAGELAQLPDVQRSVYRAAWKQRQAEVLA